MDVTTESERRSTPRCATPRQSLILTFNPTEFSQLRGQFRRRHFADGDDANEFLLQLLFAIGAHGAHPF